LGKLFEIEELTDSYVKIAKTTKEIIIDLEVSLAKKDVVIDTKLNFLDHMVETLAWGACMSIGVKAQPTRSHWLTHTIAEDVAITLGLALKSLHDKRVVKGLNGTGSGIFGLDDSLARAMINIEGRRNAFMELDAMGAKLEKVEDMLTQDCIAFVEGLSQGLAATIHLDIVKGHDPHHCWESASRALGEALKEAFADNSWRKAAENPYYAEEGVAIT
jgi:imidazoleglycerol-phosphate dehydratase